MRAVPSWRRAALVATLAVVACGLCAHTAAAQTPSPTPTGPTPTPVRDAFVCYGAKAAAGTAAFPGVAVPPGVQLADALGTATVSVSKTKSLCAPADVNEGDPGAEMHPDHLKRYPIRNKVKPRPTFPSAVSVTDRFNPAGRVVDLKKQSFLMVPAAKSLTALPTLPPSFGIDHYQCYDVKPSKGAPRFVPVPLLPTEDQFGAQGLMVKKPQHLCYAVDKNGEGFVRPDAQLLCYQVRRLEPGSFTRVPVYVRDQFGPETLKISKPAQLCVPATTNPIDTSDVIGTYDYQGESQAALAVIRPAGSDYSLRIEPQPGNYVGCLLDFAPEGSFTCDGYAISGGDIVLGDATVTGEIVLGPVVVQLSGTVTSPLFGIDGPFTMTRPVNGTPASLGGSYVFTFDGLSNTSSDTTAEIDITLPSTGFGTTSSSPEKDQDDNVVGNFSPGECLMTPLGKMSCFILYAHTIPPPPSFPLMSFHAQIAGPIATGGTVYGDTPPIPHAFPAGSWTAARP